jgi:glycogen synthase
VTTVGSRPLRLLQVAARYLPFTGGVELHVDQVARRLVQRGVTTAILTADPTRALPSRESVDGVDIRRVPAWPGDRDYLFAPGIYRELTQERWDVVHVQGYHTLVAPLAMLGARRAALPYVLTFHAGGHSSRLRHSLRPAQLTVLRPLLARAERLIALAPFEADRYSDALRLPRDRFVVIPNGSDLSQSVTPRVASDGALVASVGRLERYKGHHHVLAALPHVLRRRPEVRLWIAGSGPYEESLKLLAKKLAVSDRVEIRAVPAEERTRMANELARVKVLVLLSEFETQPLAALEALALGCRLIVADAPGLRELAEQGLARSLALDSAPEDVAAAVLEELDQPPIERPPRLPTWDDCTDALLELYLSVSSRRAH